jgi:next-to-BRCA1 protein 1
MDVDPTTPTTSSIRSQFPRPMTQHRASAPSLGACCSVSQGRAEVQEMLFNFQEGLNRVLENNLESPLVATPASSNSVLGGFTEKSASAPPPSLCSICTKNLAYGRRYSCTTCHVVVVSSLSVYHLTKDANAV